MFSLLQKIQASAAIRDLCAVGRGLYRVTEGAMGVGRVRRSSWMDDPHQFKEDGQGNKEQKHH